MNRQIGKKLHSRAGETIAETLIALLISALALVMLAGAIGTASKIITRSEIQMQAYYQANNVLAEPTGSPATINVGAGGSNIKLADETNLGVKYSKNETFTGKPVVAYVQ